MFRSDRVLERPRRRSSWSYHTAGRENKRAGGRLVISTNYTNVSEELGLGKRDPS
jgi:hypothetical protein